MWDSEVAEIAHEVNRAFCKAMGDESHAPWKEAPKEIRNSAVDGVRFHLENPHVTPEQSHENWFKFKEKDGWVFGETKDIVAKTHPCMVPYEDLPIEQKAKDHIFKAIVTECRKRFPIGRNSSYE